jgi:endonuclease/exonuclease/phosphatase family metal-dependent hydrolase
LGKSPQPPKGEPSSENKNNFFYFRLKLSLRGSGGFFPVSKRSPVRLFRIFRRLGFFGRFFWWLNVLLAFFTFAGYLSIQISPSVYWLAGFFTLALPVLLTLDVAFLAGWLLLRQWKKVLLPVFTLLAGFPLFQRTLAFHSPDPVVAADSSFEVMSYNVRTFNTEIYYKKKDKTESEAIINYVAENPAEIKCIQEFYHLDRSGVFNTIKKMTLDTQYHFFMTPFREQLHADKGFFGIAIFTKFPIVNAGEILFERRSLNKGVYADVKIGKDTVRIMNIHLQSMSINADSLFDEAELAELKKEYSDVFEKLKKGFRSRGRQAEVIEKALHLTHHPIILCGDFNDTPYSFAYQRISRFLNNSFEEKGQGFGFTYVNKNLFFLRIDNQFYDPRLQIHDFKTLFNIRHSDHFPITARYSVR